MRKSKNVWLFISLEIFLAGASEVGYWKAQNLPCSGRELRKGFGRSPKQAYANARKNAVREGNTETSSILYDHVYFKNGRVVIRSQYSDNLIKNDGQVFGQIKFANS
jgi:hypothetical protein